MRSWQYLPDIDFYTNYTKALCLGYERPILIFIELMYPGIIIALTSSIE